MPVKFPKREKDNKFGDMAGGFIKPGDVSEGARRLREVNQKLADWANGPPGTPFPFGTSLKGRKFDPAKGGNS